MIEKRYSLFRLTFKTPLHINPGNRESYEKSQDVIAGDSIKAAMMSVAFKTGFKEIIENPISFQNSFKLSSAWPFYKDHLFFPKPLLPLNISIKNKDDDKAAKLIKKIKFLEREIFLQLLNASEIHIEESFLTGDGTFCFNQPKARDKIYEKEVHERVKIANEDERSESEPYILTKIRFTEEAGLFLIAEIKDDVNREKIIKLLELLGIEGIGTDRSSGNGFFTVEYSKLELAFNDNIGGWLNLAPFIPEKEELNSFDRNKTAYNLIKRGGYLAGSSNEDQMNLRKNNIYMFGEGSIFYGSKTPVGKLVDLQPPVSKHPIWRDGRPVFFPVNK